MPTRHDAFPNWFLDAKGFEKGLLFKEAPFPPKPAKNLGQAHIFQNTVTSFRTGPSLLSSQSECSPVTQYWTL
jgi:hypothetical protein